MKKVLILAFTVALAVGGCRPEPFAPIGEPLDRVAGLEGSWNIVSVTQIDEIKMDLEEPDFSKDVTNLFGFFDYAVNFESAGSFTVTPGEAPNFVGVTEGTWAFDDPDYPTELQLTATGGTEPSATFALNRLPQEDLNLELRFERYNGDELVLSYVYVFEKATN
ncbi:MAG: DUF5004 domain-containing protein [Bacteroidota bacterium]